MDSELLECPVETDDMRDLEELIENAYDVQKDLIARIRYQYQGDSWISQSMHTTLDLIGQAHAHIAWLRSTNVFPKSEE